MKKKKKIQMHTLWNIKTESSRKIVKKTSTTNIQQFLKGMKKKTSILTLSVCVRMKQSIRVSVWIEAQVKKRKREKHTLKTKWRNKVERNIWKTRNKKKKKRNI